MSEKKQLKDEELEKADGGFFVASGSDTGGRGTTGNVKATVSHYCKACSHSWTADHADEKCPICGSTELYTVVS